MISNKYNSVSQHVLDAFDEHRGDLSSVYFSTAFLDVIKHLNHPLHGQLMALPRDGFDVAAIRVGHSTDVSDGLSSLQYRRFT